MTYTLYQNLWPIITVPALAFYEGYEVVETATEVWLLFMVGLSAFCAGMVMNRGSQLANVGKAVIFFYTIVVFSLIFDAIFLDVFPALLSILGACCIVFSAILSSLLKPEKGAAKPEKGHA